MTQKFKSPRFQIVLLFGTALLLRPCPSLRAANPQAVDWTAEFNAVGVAADDILPSVTALTEFENSLIVAGAFDAVGDIRAQNVARWDGERWHPMGAGLRFESSGWGSVFAFTVFEGSLIAGGGFTGSGAREVRGVARWNGSDWEPLGSGIDGTVSDLAVFRDRLVAAWKSNGSTGEWFKDRISMWNGTEWVPILDRFEICCSCDSRPEGRLAVYRDELYAAGNFGLGGDLDGDVIGRWNGERWIRVPGFSGTVCALQVYGDKLQAGARWSSGLFAWDGRRWEKVGGDTPSWRGDIFTMTVRDDELVVAGSFFKESPLELEGHPEWRDGNFLGELLIWDGAHWRHSDPGKSLNARISALATFDGRIAVGGEFDDNGLVPLHHVGLWDGADWLPLGPGAGLDTGGSSHPPEVRALQEYGGVLVAGGRFDYAGSLRAPSIASWNGSSWSPMQQGIEGVVEALQTFGGTLVAAGTFSRAGSVRTENIAAWDGRSWSPLDAGIHGVGVHALAVFEGRLVAGGIFNAAGGITAHGVASWDGVRWSRMGFGLFDDVRQLVVHQGQLFAAGGIDWNGVEELRGIARWDGSGWVRVDPMGDDPGITAVVSIPEGLLALLDTGELRLWDGGRWQEWQRPPEGFEVKSLGEYGGIVTISGSFLEGSLSIDDDLLMWDGTVWRSIAPEIDGTVRALADYDESLYVGGSFRTVGVHRASALARWQGSLPAVTPWSSSGDEGGNGERGVPGEGIPGVRLWPAVESSDGRVSLRYELDRDRTRVQLLLFDVRGRLVRTLVNGLEDRGPHGLRWDRHDDGGRRVPRGTYFVQLRTHGDGARHTRKLLLLQ